MNIYITLDYELFFGDNTGTLDNCIIKPTNKLLELLNPYNIKAIFFVDVGYIVALKRQINEYSKIKEDYKKIKNQLRQLSNSGHSIELHVHPHWEDCRFDGEKWCMDLSRYRIHSFSEKEIETIFNKYTNTITEITGIKPRVYRAGGWSAQPFSLIKKALENNNIFIDSTVYSGGHYHSNHQKFDFRNVKQYELSYKFSEDLTKKDKTGNFLEVPISSHKVSPIFFWKFVFVKLRKSIDHRPFGDGSAVKMTRKNILKLLFLKSQSVVSIDGYKAKFLQKAFNKYKVRTKNKGDFVVIGHPKSFTRYSLEKLKQFIRKNHQEHNFDTFNKK